MVDDATIKMLDELVEASVGKMAELERLEQTLRTLDALRHGSASEDFLIPLEVPNVQEKGNADR